MENVRCIRARVCYWQGMYLPGTPCDGFDGGYMVVQGHSGGVRRRAIATGSGGTEGAWLDCRQGQTRTSIGGWSKIYFNDLF